LFEDQVVKAGEVHLSSWIRCIRGVAFNFFSQQTSTLPTSVTYAVDIYFMPGADPEPSTADYMSVSLGTRTDIAGQWAKTSPDELDDPFVAIRGRLTGGAGIPDTLVNLVMVEF
jgi:hypothetical protein